MSDELESRLRGDFDAELVRLMNRWADNLSVLGSAELITSVVGGAMAARLGHIAGFADIRVKQVRGAPTREITDGFVDLLRFLSDRTYEKYNCMSRDELLRMMHEAMGRGS